MSYTNSKGVTTPIAAMNAFHLNNAIKKLASSDTPGDMDLHARLVAEQVTRGGPPAPKDAE